MNAGAEFRIGSTRDEGLFGPGSEDACPGLEITAGCDSLGGGSDGGGVGVCASES